jgi:hypothetical protein
MINGKKSFEVEAEIHKMKRRIDSLQFESHRSEQ